ncbi:MAG: LemA family protein [Puniceicoccales bacterium]|jgi:LemA protein|nr:LemA family protein [Puniceicoccales bacterium]
MLSTSPLATLKSFLVAIPPSVIALGVAAIVVLYGVVIYNRLVGLRNQFKNAYAQIDVQLKRRYDLIPNLVETAKAYLKHERETLESVIKARNAAVIAAQATASNPADASVVRNLLNAESNLAGALSRMRVTVESYPDLKASQNMTQLSEELTSTENKVSFARQAYNDSVQSYNTARETFPAVLLSGILGFRPAELFQVTNAVEKEAVKVQF